MTPLRLHLNENTAGCSPAVLDAIRSLTRADMAVYADYTAITAKVAAFFGVPADWVLVTNGLDEGLHLTAQSAARSMSSPPDAHTLIVEPAFEMYAHCAEAVGLGVVRVESDADLAFPLRAAVAAITGGTRLVYVTDPGNPTGLAIPPGGVSLLAAAAPHALVVIDEAYAEFSGRTAIGAALDRQRNLVVGRTFAKAYGLAGLRSGALIAHPDTLAPIRRLAPPFSVNVCAVRALEAALDDAEYLAWYVAQSVASRQLIYAFCGEHKWPVWTSEANFVLMRPGSTAASLTRDAAARGVLIRDKSAAPGCHGCIRITAGVVDDTRRCLAVLEECLAARND